MEDSATKEKGNMSNKGRPSIRQRDWVCPFNLQSFMLLLLFIPFLVLLLSPAASSMERVNGFPFHQYFQKEIILKQTTD
jgi:hypothetical protein